MAKEKQVSTEPQRRLSIFRLIVGFGLLISVGLASYNGWQWWQTTKTTVTAKPWFASYVDVTATPVYAFENLGTSAHKDAILSFIVALPNDPCTPAWGAAYTMDNASNFLDLDRRIARLQQQGGTVAISFGGQKNTELAVGCTDQAKLLAAYQSVIDRYHINTIDLDLERAGLTDPDAAVRRATVLARLQSMRRAAGKSLAIWATVPVAPQGLTEDGTNAIAALLKKGVDLAGVNLLTMDYGSSLVSGQTMLTGSESAMTETVRQLGVLYKQAGVPLNDATIWAKLGATPMIGQNDEVKEVFTLDDANNLNQFAHAHGVQRISMWSANRDIVCGSNYVNLKIVSTSCSGVQQNPGDFALALGSNFNGTITQNAGLTTQADAAASAAQLADDPATSPYQIWSPTGAYLEGTKVAWHHNVYEAKWWTEGDTPDNPVLQSWQTPWALVGPVLPGEKPVPQPTLPAGTYPEWSGTVAYNTAQRVLFNGVPYQAKWWNQGESPAAASSSPDSSPWVPLTQAQVNDIEAQLSVGKTKAQ